MLQVHSAREVAPPKKRRKVAESDKGTSLESNEATSPASELAHPAAVTRRQVAAENLKKQANRMILRGEGILPSIKVADNVLIDIPSVDRGRGDPPHLIGVVVDKKDGKLRVGFLDRWLERNCVQATSYSLLEVEDVTTDEEYSFRALVRLWAKIRVIKSATAGRNVLQRDVHVLKIVLDAIRLATLGGAAITHLTKFYYRNIFHHY